MFTGKQLFASDEDGLPLVFVPDVADPVDLVAPMRAPVVPVKPPNLAELQLAGYSYGPTNQYGGNLVAAWRYATGAGVPVALVDDGFDAATTTGYGAFSALSRNFGPGAVGDIGEPLGGFHGTATSGLIGASGVNGTPMGLAPNATIIGVKISFSAGTLESFVRAEACAAASAAVVNNSWGLTGFGAGGPNAAGFAPWYAAVQAAVQGGRGGLGSVLIFAAGNDRQNANSLAVQPLTADFRVIAVAASDVNGTVAPYSAPGSALLVAAIGDNVTVPNPGGVGSRIDSGTSYAAPSVAAVAALMLQVNPRLGWRDVQTILAASAFAPPPSAAGFSTNGATFWNGGGMHFSNDLGFGVLDANVAVNLARAWTLASTSANMVSAAATKTGAFAVGIGATVSSTLTIAANILVQHVQVSIADIYMPVASTKLVLIAPDGTKSALLSQVGLVNGRDLTGGLDVSGLVLSSNAFWGESAAGTWTLQIQDIGGRAVGVVNSWSLTIEGDNRALVAMPLIYTPEFPSLATGRTVVIPNGATTIDLIALPLATVVDLNGGPGLIDGVAVSVRAGLRNANADGSMGPVTLTGLSAGGSRLTGGDCVSTLIGAGGDTIEAGFGTTAITTGRGGSAITLSSAEPSRVTIASGGGDTIWAGLASANIVLSGAKGDTIYAQAANLTFINGSGASTVTQGTGSVLIQAGAGGGVYYAGTGGNSRLTAGTGAVVFHGTADGDVLTAAGAANDVLIAGSGNETLNGGGNTGALSLIGGSGADLMIAGQGRTTFTLGTGNGSLTFGGLGDVVQLQAGLAGGLDLLTGFRIGVDFLRLTGFASTEAATALSRAASDGHGGTLLRFSDNTRLDFLGLASVGRGIFG